jgi:hypothetical protein
MEAFLKICSMAPVAVNRVFMTQKTNKKLAHSLTFKEVLRREIQGLKV